MLTALARKVWDMPSGTKEATGMIWPSVPLEKLARVSGGSTPKRNNDAYWNGDVPWVTPSDLPAPGASIIDVEDTKDHLTQEGLNSCSAPLLPPEYGALLLSRDHWENRYCQGSFSDQPGLCEFHAQHWC